MKTTEARKLLPVFARSLAPEAETVAELRTAVLDEIDAWEAGANPLTVKQVMSLKDFLRKVALV